MCTHTCPCPSAGAVHRIKGWRVLPFLITPPCRQPRTLRLRRILIFKLYWFVLLKKVVVLPNTCLLSCVVFTKAFYFYFFYFSVGGLFDPLLSFNF